MPLPFPVDAAQQDHLSIVSNGGYYTNDDSEVGTPFSPGPDPINGYLIPQGFPEPHRPQFIHPPPFPFDPSNPQMLHQYGPPMPLIEQHPDFYGPYGEPDLPAPSSPPQGHVEGENGYQNGIQHHYMEQHYDLPEASASSPRPKPPPKRKTKRVRQQLPKVCSFCFGTPEKNRESVPEDLLTCNACQRSGGYSHGAGELSRVPADYLRVGLQVILAAYRLHTSLMQSGRMNGNAKNARIVRSAAERIKQKGKEKAVEPMVIAAEDAGAAVTISGPEEQLEVQASESAVAPPKRKITIKQNNRNRDRERDRSPLQLPERDSLPPTLPPIRLVRRRSTTGNGVPGPKVRLKLGKMKDKTKGRAKASAETTDAPEEIVPDVFQGVLNPADADVSKTSIFPDDQERFESSKAAAERVLGPFQTLPLPLSTAQETPGPKQLSIEPEVTIQPTRSHVTLRHLRRLNESVLSTPRQATPSERDAGQTPTTARPMDGSAPGPTLRIRSIRFGEHEIDTWYDAPFSEEYASVPDGRLWICEFCLRYMKSAFSAGRHRMKCKARHPPGDEIYRDDTVSVFEVDGRKNKIYCQNLCLLSKMFLDHKSLFYDVEPFLFYVITEMDDIGARFVGYFSKEKRSLKEHNLSCIMTLPVRQKKGWGNLLIDFKTAGYLLSKKEGRIGGPETPLSALGAISYKRYWTLTLMYYFRSCPKDVSLPGISVETSMTMQDVFTTLRDNNMITVLDPMTASQRHVASGPPGPRPRGRPPRGGHPPGGSIARRNAGPGRPPTRKATPVTEDGDITLPRLYRIHWDSEVVKKYIAQWEERGYLQLKPELLKWSPFLLGRIQEVGHIISDVNDVTANAEESKGDDLALVDAMVKRAVTETARLQQELVEMERIQGDDMEGDDDGSHADAMESRGSRGGRSPRPLRPPKGFIPTKAPRHRVETPARHLVRTRSSRDIRESSRTRRSSRAQGGSISSDGEEVSSGRSLRRLRIRDSMAASPREVAIFNNSRKRKRLPSSSDIEEYVSAPDSDDENEEGRRRRNRPRRSTTSFATSLSHDTGGDETPGRRRLRSAGDDLENGLHTATPRSLRSSRVQPIEQNGKKASTLSRRRIESSPEQEAEERRGSARRSPPPPAAAPTPKLTVNGKRRGRPPKPKPVPAPTPTPVPTPSRHSRNGRFSKAGSRRSTPTEVTEAALVETDAEGEAEVERVIASPPSSPESRKSTTEAQRRLRSLRLDFESTGSLSSVGPDYRELTPAEAGPAPVMNHSDAPSAGLELVLGDRAAPAQDIEQLDASGASMMKDDSTVVATIAPDSLEVGQETEEDAEVAPPPIHHHPQYAYAMNPIQQREHNQPIYQSAQPTPSLSQSQQSSTRKRKRAVPPPSVQYHTEKHYDDLGELREFLVIEDTPPPGGLAVTPAAHHSTSTTGLTPSISTTFTSSGGVRTRAQAAAAATQNESVPPSSSQHALSLTNGGAPPAKRRKKETFADDTPVAGPSRQHQHHLNGNANGNGAGPSGAYARKAIASRAYENNKHTGPGGSAVSWVGQGSGGTESVRESQVSQASTQAQPAPSPVYDDKDGYYIINANDVIGNPPRYRIIRLLGQGTFGKVVEAWDCINRTRVAVKIIRAIPKYRDASKIEIRVLRTLKLRDPTNLNKCIHLEEWFDYRNHICIVTELLGLCIYDFLRENEFQPFPRRHIQDFAKQLLQGVAFLHELNLIHTDLKPENILLVDNSTRIVSVPPPPGSRSKQQKQKKLLNTTEVRLIDFGSATFDDEYHPTVVSTRHYRAPEIILGLGWSFPCDAFSIGCILVEFYTGGALFQTHDNLEHLAMMEAAMGKVPSALARRAVRTKAEFFKVPANGNAAPTLDYPKPKISRQSRKEVKAIKSLEEIIKPIDITNMRFLDLVKKLLMWEPTERITVRDALSHPYFDLTIALEP
ncbi:dual specificity protein kinase kns1 [Tulasnella sp. 330]|nr:dual specificity protein kinase kns1 [Tulasnella sp. 330]